MGSSWGCCFVAAAMLVLGSVAQASQGTVVDVVVHGVGLEGNLLGDSPDRAVSVYLPPGYDEEVDVRYPVLYLLHGHPVTHQMWVGGGYNSPRDLVTVVDGLVMRGAVQPMIIVMPDAMTTYGGSYYTNSAVNGAWEDFIADELVRYVDGHFRTLARPESRAIAGHSAGGFGALAVAMKHPERYSVVYAMSPANIDLLDVSRTGMLSGYAFLRTIDLLDRGVVPRSGWNGAHVRLAAAFSPDVDRPPAYVDLPYVSVDGQPRRLDEVWQRWVAHTPLAMLPRFGANLLLYRGVGLDAASNEGDPDTGPGVRAFSDALGEMGIDHRFEVYEGTHTSEVASRLESVVLPFVSERLDTAWRGRSGQVSGTPVR